MIVPDEVRQRFDASAHLIAQLSGDVRAAVLTFCAKNLYAFTDRAKTLESFAEKLETGRFARWSDVDDRYACTIIVPTLEEEDGVIAFIEKAFAVREIKRRSSTEKDPQLFRFDSTRISATLKTADADLAELPLYKVLFEVQVRTAYEHAWSVSTHALVYKADKVDWRRLRIAAQMKALVEQLDLTSVAFDEMAEKISPSEWPDVTVRRKIVEAYKQWFVGGIIPVECAPKDWTRFAENILGLIRANGIRRSEISGFVDQMLGTVEQAARQYSQVTFPRTVSLAQFTIGALCHDGLIGNDLRHFVPLVTPALVELFPEVGALTATFALDT